MARLPRLHVPGGVYSIVLRGNRGQPIFQSDEDRLAFGRFVGKSLARHGTRVFAYCWMETRVNLAVQVEEEPVEGFVRGVAGPYARRVHRQAGIGGTLFAPRYLSVLVDENGEAHAANGGVVRVIVSERDLQKGFADSLRGAQHSLTPAPRASVPARLQAPAPLQAPARLQRLVTSAPPLTSMSVVGLPL